MGEATFTPASKPIISGEEFLLGVKPQTMVADNAYTFTLSCSGIDESSSITVSANSPPIPGIFHVDPIQGTEATTSFTFMSLNWEDVDLPLQYHFGYLDSSNSFLGLHKKSERSNMFTLLPASTDIDNILTTVVHVFDSNNAMESEIFDVSINS